MHNLLDRNAKLLVVIGPSGVGKSAVIEQLIEQQLVEVTPSWTTRPKRSTESDDDYEHIFCNQAAFEAKEAAGDFLETVQPFGLPYHYGLPAIGQPAHGKVALIMLRAPFLELLAQHYSNAVIYQIERSEADVRAALEARQISGDQLGSRLQDYAKEIALGKMYAQRIFSNDQLSETATAVVKALHADFTAELSSVDE